MSLLSSQAPSREYANRPADERYPSVQAMIDAAEAERKRSAERTFNVKDLRAVAVATADVPQLGEVRLQNPQGNVAKFTNWAFGQFSRMVGAPASYLRDIPAALAAQCLNYGISQTSGDAVLLVKAPNGDPSPIVRACTSDSYARVWDGPLYSAVQQQIIAHDPRWTLPPTWSGESAGAYRGDRDSFLVLVNGGSIVTDPTLRSSASGVNTTTGRPVGLGSGSGPVDGMYRGLLIRNSEVGASSITIESILYRYICGNHLLWGAVMDRSFRRRHVGTKVVRDAIREISQFAYNYVNRSAERDNAIISQLVTSQLAQTKEAVIDELRKLGATKEQAESAYTVCEEKETASPRSYWGLAQGMTRLSQESAWQDGRFELDQLAAKILSRGAKLVRA